MESLLHQAGYNIVRFTNFNFLSIPGWWINTCLFKRKQMSRLQLKLYDMMVPAVSIVERILPLPGLSLLCVAEKPRQNWK